MRPRNGSMRRRRDRRVEFVPINDFERIKVA